jgi:FtsX-like permease family
LPLASVRTMQEVYDKSVARTSFTLVMLGIAGAMALALGIIGIYGVMSYTVSQRKREIGIRLALGAQAGDVLQMVLRQGTKLALAGMVIGLIAAAEPTLRHQVLPAAKASPSRPRPSSIASRNGSQKLVDRVGFPSFGFEALNSTPNPVVTSFSLAGFAVSAFAFPYWGLPAPSGVRVPFRTN